MPDLSRRASARPRSGRLSEPMPRPAGAMVETRCVLPAGRGPAETRGSAGCVRPSLTRHVAHEHRTTRERARLDQSQSQPALELREEWRATARDGRVDDELVLID